MPRERAPQRPCRTPWWPLVLLLACGEPVPPADPVVPPAAPTEPPSVSTLTQPPSPLAQDEVSSTPTEAPSVVTIPASRGPLRFDSVGGMTADGVLPMPEGPCLLREEELLACWRADEQDFVELPQRRYVIPHTELAIEDGVVVRASDGQAVPAHGALAPALVSAHGSDLVYVSSDGVWHHRTDHDDHAIEVTGDLADDPLTDLFAECALSRSGAVYCLREDSPNLHEATQVARVSGAVRLVSTRWSEPPLGPDEALGPAPVTPSLRARCVLRDDGEVICSVQRGEAQAPPFRPLSALGPGSFQAIDAAGRHLCALTDDGEVRCLDLEERARANVPVGGAAAIAVADQRACALTRGRAGPVVRCWPLPPGGRSARALTSTSSV